MKDILLTEECQACKSEQIHSGVYKNCFVCVTKEDNKLMEEEMTLDSLTLCTSIKCPLRSSCVRFSYKEEDYVNMPQEDFFKKLGRSKLCPSYIGRILYGDNSICCLNKNSKDFKIFWGRKW